MDFISLTLLGFVALSFRRGQQQGVTEHSHIVDLLLKL